MSPALSAKGHHWISTAELQMLFILNNTSVLRKTWAVSWVCKAWREDTLMYNLPSIKSIEVNALTDRWEKYIWKQPRDVQGQSNTSYQNFIS